MYRHVCDDLCCLFGVLLFYFVYRRRSYDCMLPYGRVRVACADERDMARRRRFHEGESLVVDGVTSVHKVQQRVVVR